METNNWRRKEIWSREGDNFMVQVSRHEVQRADWGGCESEGPHRWCMYAFIYPKHRLFHEFSGPKMWQPAASMLPLHGGPSLLRWHYDDDGKPTSVQVGADYNHLHDWRYTQMATADEARAVFNDADELFRFLSPWDAQP